MLPFHKIETFFFALLHSTMTTRRQTCVGNPTRPPIPMAFLLNFYVVDVGVFKR